MATYQITSPQGQKFEITAPDDATEDQVMAYAQSQLAGGLDLSTAKPVEQSKKKPTTGSDALDYFGEGAMAVGANIANEAYAGLRGIANLPHGLDAATAAIRDQQQNPIYTPKTEQGQKAVERAGELADMGTQAVRYPMSGLAGLGELATGNGINQASNTMREVQDKGFGQVLADRTYNATGSPAAATAALVSPDVAGVVAGGRAINAAKIPKRRLIEDGELTPQFRKALQKQGVMSGQVGPGEVNMLPDVSPKRAANELVLHKLKNGASDDFLAPIQLDDFGKIGPDDLAIEAERQGFVRGNIMAVKTADEATLKGMNAMLKKHRSIKANSGLADTMRHTDVVGDSAMARFNHVRDRVKADTKELDRIVTNDLAGVMVDASRVERVFYNGLDKLGVRYDTRSVPPVMEFVGSDISKNPSAKRFIKDVASLLAEDIPPTAARAHRLKKQLDELIDFNKKSKGGLSEAGRNFAKSVRYEINQVIRAVDQNYGMVNDRLHAGIDAINDFDDSMGSQINVFEDGAASAVGTNLRKLLTNYGTRQKIENAAVKLDQVARDFGGDFGDNLTRLVDFGYTLDDKFGAVSARGNFQSRVAAGTENAINSAIRGDLKSAAINKASEKVADFIEGQRGINDDNGYRSMQSLIMRELSNRKQSQGTR